MNEGRKKIDDNAIIKCVIIIIEENERKYTVEIGNSALGICSCSIMKQCLAHRVTFYCFDINRTTERSTNTKFVAIVGFRCYFDLIPCNIRPVSRAM